MELVLGQGEMENLRHLGFGVTPGTCIGHRQSRRDAAGREEQIAGLLGSESGIKVEGELVIAIDYSSSIGTPGNLFPDPLERLIGNLQCWRRTPPFPGSPELRWQSCPMHPCYSLCPSESKHLEAACSLPPGESSSL